MADADLHRQALQGLDAAVALCAADGSVLFENSLFFKWFAPGPEVDSPLWSRLPGLELERALERIGRGRSHAWEAEIQAGARTLSLALELKALKDDPEGRLLLQAFNASKQKEAEYMLDSYSKLAEKNARELQREKERVEKLLLNVMPRSVYEELKDYGTTTPQRFEAASVLMLDFVGFTEMAVSGDPSALISELNDIFSAFDRIVELFGCERIKTIGDGYVAVSGLPESTPEHASNIAKVALRMKRYLERRNAAHTNQWRCRIGVATGPVIGSMVGIQKYVYDIFGPAPNLAARMEALAEPMQIVMNAQAVAALSGEFVTASQGVVDVKGFGEMEVFSLEFERTGGRG